MMTLDGANEGEIDYGDTPKDEDLMGSLFISDEGEIRCEASWDWDETPLAGWEEVAVPVKVEAGIRQLICERDLARAQASHFADLLADLRRQYDLAKAAAISWEETCRELHQQLVSRDEWRRIQAGKP